MKGRVRMTRRFCQVQCEDMLGRATRSAGSMYHLAKDRQCEIITFGYGSNVANRYCTCRRSRSILQSDSMRTTAPAKKRKQTTMVNKGRSFPNVEGSVEQHAWTSLRHRFAAENHRYEPKSFWPRRPSGRAVSSEARFRLSP